MFDQMCGYLPSKPSKDLLLEGGRQVASPTSKRHVKDFAGEKRGFAVAYYILWLGVKQTQEGKFFVQISQKKRGSAGKKVGNRLDFCNSLRYNNYVSKWVLVYIDRQRLTEI